MADRFDATSKFTESKHILGVFVFVPHAQHRPHCYESFSKSTTKKTPPFTQGRCSIILRDLGWRILNFHEPSIKKLAAVSSDLIAKLELL